MKLLVTGARGFTGQHFCSLATRSGYDVVELKSDLLDYAALQYEIRKLQPELVLHLAAVSFVGSLDQLSFYAGNVIGTTNLLEAISKLPNSPGKILLISSANIYGNCDILPIDENVLPNPINHYGASKFAMEQLARTYRDKLPIVIARPFNYTGPGQHVNFVIPKLVNHFINKNPSVSLGNIAVKREFNDVNMVCNSYLRLLDYGTIGEVYNICSGTVYSLQYVINTLTKLTGHLIEVSVDQNFVRTNEVSILKGDPKKLNDLVSDNFDSIQHPSLETTLLSMLNAGAL